MDNKRNILGIIPARGGSKAIANKNTRLLVGKPLIHYSHESAKSSGVIDRIILSTDSEEIAEVGRKLGIEVPFMRPDELAQDETPMLPVVQHAVQELEGQGWHADIIILLQPTSPLRLPSDIRRTVELFEETGCDSVTSVTQIPSHLAPHYAMKTVDGKLKHFLPEGKLITRRQDVPPAYTRNGIIFAVLRDVLMNENTLYGEHCHPLFPESHQLNVNDEDEWNMAEKLIAEMYDTKKTKSDH